MNGLVRVFRTAAGGLCLLALPLSPAAAQGLEVTPVIVQLAPGQAAAALTITNDSDHKMSFQIRGFTWQQDGSGNDSLTQTDELLSSPPLATIQPGGSQVVRLILRNPPASREETYRIIFDQLPPPAEAGVVHVLVRLSIPVFAEPRSRIAPQVRWRVVSDGARWWLTATNSGTQHMTVRTLALETPDRKPLRIEINSPPHILAGATRRWSILSNGVSAHEMLRLTGTADSGVIDQSIAADAGP